MTKLVESVPNFSEGRRIEVVDKLAAAVETVPGAHLLDRTSDASHNRSVLTIAGNPAAVLEALERTVAVAVSEIDMESHVGEHPRIGAVDVVPFVPLAGATMADCIELARTFGAIVADRFAIPVYLYGEAATSPARAGAWRMSGAASTRVSGRRSVKRAGSLISARSRCTPLPEPWRWGRGRF